MLVKPWLVGQETREIYNNLFRELRLEDKEEYKKFLKMDAEKFNGLSLRCVCFFKKSRNSHQSCSVREGVLRNFGFSFGFVGSLLHCFRVTFFYQI